MAESLARCKCRVCQRDYDFGGPDQLGYDPNLCGPMCDGFEAGMRRVVNEISRLAEHYERQSSNFMAGDIRGPMMKQAADDMNEAIERAKRKAVRRAH